MAKSEITTEFRIDFPSASRIPAEAMAIATLLHEEADVVEAQIAEIYQQEFSKSITRFGLKAPSGFPRCETTIEQADRLFAVVVSIHLRVEEANYDMFSALAWRDTFTLSAAGAIKVVTGAFLQAGLGVPVALSVDCSGLGIQWAAGNRESVASGA